MDDRQVRRKVTPSPVRTTRNDEIQITKENETINRKENAREESKFYSSKEHECCFITPVEQKAGHKVLINSAKDIVPPSFETESGSESYTSSEEDEEQLNKLKRKHTDFNENESCARKNLEVYPRI